MAKSKSSHDTSIEQMEYWRPSETIVQESVQQGSSKHDWSKTFHVDTVEGFVNGLFGLHKDVFIDFIKDVASDCSIGKTVLYQSANPLKVRFEIKKIGYNEFQVRGAHFGTNSNVNICVGLNPQEGSNQHSLSGSYYPFYYYFTPDTQSLKNDFYKRDGKQILGLVDDLQSEAAVITTSNFEQVKAKISELATKLGNYLLY